MLFFMIGCLMRRNELKLSGIKFLLQILGPEIDEALRKLFGIAKWGLIKHRLPGCKML